MTIPRTLHTWIAAVLANIACTSVIYVLLLIGVLAGQTAQAAMPPGGTVINNRAEASYIPSGATASETLYSNTVQATVQNVEALTLTHDQTITLPPGSNALIVHVLTNTGNVTSDYLFSLPNANNDDYNLDKLALVHDLDNDGQFEASTDQPIKLVPFSVGGVNNVNSVNSRVAATGFISLAPGESATLLVMGQVPATQNGGLARILLGVKTKSQGVSGFNTDIIKASNAAVMSIVKKADQAGPVKMDQKVRYTLTAANIGNQPALPFDAAVSTATPIKLDGVAKSFILIHDVIPEGTLFAGGLSSSNANAVKMYRIRGTTAFDYQSTFIEQSLVTEVAIGLPSEVDVNASVSMSFDVKVSGNESGKIINSGFVAFNDGAANTDVESNRIVLNLDSNNLSIGIAKKAGTVTANRNADGQLDGTYTVPLTFTVKNYGDAPVYDLAVNDLLEGDKLFGAYVKKAMPGKGQYTVVANTGIASTPTQGAKVAYNNRFTGQPGSQNMLAPNAILPVGGTFTVQFSVRLFPADGISEILNTATANAAEEPAGSLTIVDDSVNGTNPDPDGNKIHLKNRRPRLRCRVSRL